MKKTFMISICTTIVFLIIASDLLAIPAFARKYNMSCKTCHSPFPHLKPYGDEFAGNGFVLKDKDAPRYFVNTGDNELSLIRDFPIAVRLQGFITYNEENTDQLDFTGPSVFKVLSGGAITNNVSYYVYYILENGEAGKIEDAFLMLNNLFDSELDFYIGQYQVSDPLFKRELRLTNQDYLIYKVRPGRSTIDLTYDRGIMFTYSFSANTDVTLEVVNGSGIGELAANNLFDKDKYKNFFGRVSQDICDYLRIGAFGYYGNELIDRDGLELQIKNELWMAGGDASVSFDKLELNLQYMKRNDSNPYGQLLPGDHLKTDGGFAELIFKPNGDDSKWYAVALYNQIESADDTYDHKSISGHIGYLLRRNIRLIGEFIYDIKYEYGKLNIGFVSAF